MASGQFSCNLYDHFIPIFFVLIIIRSYDLMRGFSHSSIVEVSRKTVPRGTRLDYVPVFCFLVSGYLEDLKIRVGSGGYGAWKENRQVMGRGIRLETGQEETDIDGFGHEKSLKKFSLSLEKSRRLGIVRKDVRVVSVDSLCVIATCCIWHQIPVPVARSRFGTFFFEVVPLKSRRRVHGFTVKSHGGIIGTEPTFDSSKRTDKIPKWVKTLCRMRLLAGSQVLQMRSLPDLLQCCPDLATFALE